MKGVQCYELFGGIALKNHTFSFSFSLSYGFMLKMWNCSQIMNVVIGYGEFVV